MTVQRDRKLAEMARIAHGLQHGMAAFDDRSEEMGAGPGARGGGRGGKGSHSSPVETEVVRGKGPVVVTPDVDRAVDRAHAAMLDLEARYRTIAQPVIGLPTEGEGNCEWCEAAARAWRNEAMKAGDEAAAGSVVSVHRCRPYLFAKLVDGAKVTRALVCEWCYRFNLREGRPPTTEELWLHAQGHKVLVKPGKRPKMKAAKRVSVNGS